MPPLHTLPVKEQIFWIIVIAALPAGFLCAVLFN